MPRYEQGLKPEHGGDGVHGMHIAIQDLQMSIMSAPCCYASVLNV